MVRYIETNGADTLVVAARWTYHFDRGDAVERGLMAFLLRVSPHVDRILLLGPTPEMRDMVLRCMKLGEDCSIPRAEFEAKALRSRALLARFDALPKVEVIDAAEWLCDRRTCPDRIGGSPLYLDANHVSRFAASQFAQHYLDASSTPKTRTE